MNLKIFFLLIFFSKFALAQSHINIIEDKFEQLTISKQYIYSNTSDTKNINEVINNNSLFNFTTKEFINSGVFTPYNWIKIKVINSSKYSNFIFEFNQTYIDSLQFFIVKNKRILRTYPKKGLHFKENNNPSFLLNKYAYIYPFSIPKNDTISIYINGIVNDGAFRVTNKVWSLSKYKKRQKDIKIRSTYLIFFAGFTTLVLLLSIAMFIFTSNRLYIYYAGFVFVIFLNLVVVRHFFSPLYVEKYLFYGNNFSEMFGLLQLFLVLMYVNHFFTLKKDYYKLYVIIKTLALVTFFLFVLSLYLRRFDWFYAFSYYFTKIEMVLVTLFLYGVAIYLISKKNIMAYYFVIAYFPLVFFIGHFILTALKLTESFNPLQWEFVIFFEIFVLTIAMAHKYFLLMKENLIYQKKIHGQKVKISRDLHDNIGSQLTFIISSIENLQYIAKSSDKVLQEKLSNINEFASNAISKLRDTIWAINKNEISSNDFYSRVLAFIEKAKSAKSDIIFSVQNNIDTEYVFSSIKGISTFRVIQEAVNNAIKYAEASKIDIIITEKDNNLIFSILDNGKGFDIHNIKFGNGLENMQKRIDEVGGILNIESKLGKGTTIKVICNKNTMNIV